MSGALDRIWGVLWLPVVVGIMAAPTLWFEYRAVELWHYEIHCVDMHGEPYRLEDWYWTKEGWPQYGESFKKYENCTAWKVGEAVGNCAGRGCRPY